MEIFYQVVNIEVVNITVDFRSLFKAQLSTEVPNINP